MSLTIWNYVLSCKQKNFFSENWLVLPRNYFPGCNFLLPTFLTSGKGDFQVANLLLDTVNFEPWVLHCLLRRICLKIENFNGKIEMFNCHLCQKGLLRHQTFSTLKGSKWLKSS